MPSLGVSSLDFGPFEGTASFFCPLTVVARRRPVRDFTRTLALAFNEIVDGYSAAARCSNSIGNCSTNWHIARSSLRLKLSNDRDRFNVVSLR